MKFTCGLLLLATTLAGQTQPPTIAAVTNFNAGNKFSPAAYAFLFGTNFGTAPKVFVGTTQCPMFYVSDTYFSFQIPAGAPVGPSTITVQTGAGTSAPFAFTISPTSPVIATVSLTPPLSYFFDLTPFFTPIATPTPGQRVYMEIDGVGPTRPPIPPQILIDGKDVPVLAATTFKAFIGAVNSALGDLPAFTIQIPNLPGGPHTLEVVAGAASTGQLQFTILARGLFTSQTGLTFNAVQGGPPIPNQSFAVLSGQGTLNFSLSSSTVSGGSWLSATPSTGSATVSTAGAPIQVQANPSNLAIGTYYGSVTIASPDVPNSPQTVTVVLNVSAKVGPSISKTGVIFVSAAGTNPPAQTITAFNPTVGTVSYTSSLQSAAPNLFSASPATGNIASGQSATINIVVPVLGIAAGVNTAKLTLSFSDGTTRTVNLLLVVTPGAGGSSTPLRDAGSCAPTKLLPVFTQVGDIFSVPAAWPTAVEATIVDDCGNPMNKGSVVLAFSNGDPPLRLDPSLAGVWSVTWPPANPRASVTLTLTAAQSETKLNGTAQISGGVSANPAVPQVSAGGVVETAAYGSPVAPGNLISIFGAELSSSTAPATSVPLPNKLLDTSVLIDGQNIPLFYTSTGQVNAVVPYGLSVNALHQLVVQRGNSLSVPQSVLVGAARPGVFTIDASGAGQGHIYKIDAAGNQIRADKNAPAKAGDTLVIYCSGLGAVNPPLTAGTAAPLTFLTKTVNTLTAAIGGVSAVVNFAGLTPGSTGLYQVNAVVPAGLPDSDTTPLVLTISGQDSAAVTLAVHK